MTLSCSTWSLDHRLKRSMSSLGKASGPCPGRLRTPWCWRAYAASAGTHVPSQPESPTFMGKKIQAGNLPLGLYSFVQDFFEQRTESIPTWVLLLCG